MESQHLTYVSASETDVHRGSELWFQLPPEDDRSEVVGQSSANPTHEQTSYGASHNQIQTPTLTNDLRLQQLGDRSCSLQLEFQDSRLSPSLALLQSNSGKTYSFADVSLFQQTDLEFAPLRGSPDISVASDRFVIPPWNRRVAPLTDHASLSQHPLVHTTTLSEDGASSCCSLSQHSMSPEDESRRPEGAPATVKSVGGKMNLTTGVAMRGRDDQAPTRPDNPLGAPFEDDTTFLSGDVPAWKLLELLQKDVGMPSGSSSAVSSTSTTSLNRTSSSRGCKTGGVPAADASRGVGNWESSRGGPETREQAAVKPLRISEVSNITTRSLDAQPDDGADVLREQLLSEIGRSHGLGPGPETHGAMSQTPDRKDISPDKQPTGMLKGRASGTRGALAGASGAWLSAGHTVERGHRERDLWSSGNQTGTDGSFLGLLSQPVSQSTPGVFHAPVKSGTKPKLGLLSAIESNLEASRRSGARSSTVASMPDIDAVGPDTARADYEMSREPSGKVHSLPSLNYLEKVDAWRANQSSGKTSLFDNLALQGFSSGVSPKQRAYDAISDSLNRMLTPQEASKTRQLPASSTSNTSSEQNPVTSRSGPPSPIRGEAVGCAPRESEDTVAAGVAPAASPLGRSRSPSSFSTVIASTRRAQQPPRSCEREGSQTREEQSISSHPEKLERDQSVRGADDVTAAGRTVADQLGSAALPSALASLGRFSDAASSRDASGALSSSEGSRHSGQMNLGASVGASSVVSLEVDNYAPYWTSKASSPAKERELNIEERIPMYLHNLGIEQSPLTILTPFGPRGPIREPEFSPTDLCTIKGSIGTPTKSTQPSEEGGTPHKEEFSRSSLLSMDSSMSAPLSVDSLHPTVPLPSEQTEGSLSPDGAPVSRGGPGSSLSTQPSDTNQHPLAQPTDHRQRGASSIGVTGHSAPELPERFDLGADRLAPDRELRWDVVRDWAMDGARDQADQDVAGDRDVARDRDGVRDRDGTRDQDMARDRGLATDEARDQADRDVVKDWDRARDQDGERDRGGARDREGVRGQDGGAPEANSSAEQSHEDSFLGSKTLREIRQLLGRAQNIVSGGSSLDSSTTSSSQRHIDHDMLLSVRRKLESFQDSSFTSSSAGDPRSHSSLVWGRSSSDSVLTSSDRLGASSVGREAGRLAPRDPPHQSAQSLSLPRASEAYVTPQEVTDSALPPSKSVRRAEPEGCSAGPADTTGPMPVAFLQVGGPAAISKPPQVPAEASAEVIEEAGTAEVAEEAGTAEVTMEAGTAEVVVANNGSSSSSASPVGSEQGAMSDGSSSQSSLAARVAQLLQSQSSTTMVSSRTSSSDLEESRAREWLKLKVSGQRCGPLELDTEDRMRIEEIKRELLLHTKHTLKSQGSTDTESSAFSSLGGPGVQPSSQPVGPEVQPSSQPVGPGVQPSSQPVGPGVQPSSQLVGPSNALRAAEDRLSHQLQSLSRNPFNASAPLNTRPDLEARVREIAQREGLSFPGPRPPPLTSITIATCRRSLTPSPSPSSLPTPEPLHLNQLSPEPLVPPASQALSPSLHTQVDEGTTVTLETSGYPARSEPDSSLNARHQDFADSQSDSGFQQGRKASGSQSDLRALSQGSQMEEAIARHDAPTRRDQEEASCGHPVSPTPSKYGQISCSYANAGSPGAGLGRSTDGVFSSVTRSPAKLGHVSRVHLTLSPKVTDQALASDPSSGHPALGTWLPAAEFAPFGHSSTVSGGLAGGLSHTPQSLLSNQERCQQGREPVGVQTARVPEPTTAFKYPRAFTPPQRLAGPPRPSTVRVPVPLLLPYKPHGSEELFYMPQTEARLSTMPQTEARLAPLPQTEARLPPMLQTETRLSTMPQTEARLPLMPQSEAQLSPIRSDTTVESSHPGSDDAVPPRFSAEVLGSRDQEEDHGVAIRHTEGIYSKRLKEPSRNMQAAHTGGVESADRGSQTSEWRSSQASTQSADVLTRRRPSSGHRVPADHMRDRGTSPNVPDIPGQRSPSSSLREDMEEFQPLRGEMDYSMDDQHSHPIAGALPPDYGRRRDPALAKATSQPAESHLDDLWRRFSERWGAQEELRLPSEREASLLERLERLSRLIHSTDGSPSPSGAGKNTVEVPDPTSHEPRGRREGAVETEGRRQAWGPQEAQEEPQAGGAEEEEGPASASSGASLSRHLCPAERDESGETSSCTSTVDTVRLVRAFGSHRVRGLKTDSGRGLGKLYSAIGKQREGKEQRRGRGVRARDTPAAVLSEIARTDDSRVTADSASSSSTYTLPTGRGPAHFFPAKKPVKLVSKSIQTGDLEIVSNGTRRHTRDVGTTFPSPGLARGSKLPSSSHSSSSSIGERGKGVPERSPPKAQTFLRERKSKGRRSLAKHYPQGVSWFVPADDLRAESRKENQPETAAVPKPGPAWFQPYSRTRPWREPLRQRQVREDLDHNQTTRPLVISEPQPELSGKPSSALVRITLQEALEMRRPEFVSGSRERLKRLALKVEERKLQAVFSRERDELFNRPGGPGRLPKPAGTALFKRAVPKKEMVQRSKQIYSQLPEVQKRREEERRKAEYRSYRLNAQLYNKRITNHVLGKRTPWQ